MASDSGPTRTSDGSVGPAAPSDASGLFTPGVVLGGRYRIVSLLGRGGMGEVYRADDLKLGQPVALKFLPERLAHDPSRLARFLGEVRLARQVTHPNVCRVHDVGEAQGQHFLSMEYVDGEDLASLLRRAGRLSFERGIELARQVCLGLAAAHERGVLHRDLKPANVMVDGRGRARLADFGLAVAADDAARSSEIAGTPAYMAPEQLAGAALSERTDVYALGLVLYEIFTGRPAFKADTLKELLRQQREVPPPPPSTHVAGLDVDLEHLILRCLEKDPARRPASAIAVAVSLPGGDPVAALVAAGETPPPELVAAAGRSETIPLPAAWAAFAFVLASLPLAIGLMAPHMMLSGVPLDKPPEVLVERAHEVALLAVPAGNARAWGFERAPATSSTRVRFWYREAPARMDGLSWTGIVGPDDPPLGPGMVRVRTDTEGRLLELVAVPGREAAPGDPDWPALLRMAGVDPATVRAAPADHVPPVFADRRAAWQREGAPSIRAAALGAHPVYFSLIPEGAERSERARALDRGTAVVVWLTLLFSAVLAWRNLRSGRGDRQGAQRVFTFAAVLRFAVLMLLAPHTGDVAREYLLVVLALSRALFAGAQTWLFYLAIEPAIRRRWPDCLVSWTRVLQGRIRDPRVGRDVLVGITAAVAVILCWVGVLFVQPPPKPIPVDLGLLLGFRPLLASLLQNAVQGVVLALLLMVLALLALMVFRDLRVALSAATIVLTIVAVARMGWSGPASILPGLLITGILLAVLLRFGMLTTVVIAFFLGSPAAPVPFTLEFGAWHGQAALGWMLSAYALAAFGLYVGTGGRPLPATLVTEE